MEHFRPPKSPISRNCGILTVTIRVGARTRSHLDDEDRCSSSKKKDPVRNSTSVLSSATVCFLMVSRPPNVEKFSGYESAVCLRNGMRGFKSPPPPTFRGNSLLDNNRFCDYILYNCIHHDNAVLRVSNNEDVTP